MTRWARLLAGLLLLSASLPGCSGWPPIHPQDCRPLAELLIPDQPGLTRAEIVSELLHQHQVPPVVAGVRCFY